MKHMLLMNPGPYRRKKTRKTSTARRRTKRRRASKVNTMVRVNPPKARRVRRIRRKRRSTTSRAVTRYVAAALPARRKRRHTMKKLRRRNRISRGSSMGIRGILSKDNIQRAAGFVIGGIGTGFVLNKFASSLPGYTKKDATGASVKSPIGAALWNAAIPIAGAIALRKTSPRISEGLVIGGIVSAIYSVMAIVSAQSGTVKPTGAYFDGDRKTRGVEGYLDKRTSSAPVGYDGVNAFGASPDAIFQSQSAFPKDAWSR